eukprot:UN27856
MDLLHWCILGSCNITNWSMVWRNQFLTITLVGIRNIIWKRGNFLQHSKVLFHVFMCVCGMFLIVFNEPYSPDSCMKDPLEKDTLSFLWGGFLFVWIIYNFRNTYLYHIFNLTNPKPKITMIILATTCVRFIGNNQSDLVRIILLRLEP